MDAPTDGHASAGPPAVPDRTGGSGARRSARHRDPSGAHGLGNVAPEQVASGHVTSGRGLGVQTTPLERKRAFARARWNTRLVRLLRRLIPVGTVGLVVVYVGSAFQNFEFTSNLPTLSIPQITSEDLTMNNPRYSGFTKDGGSYDVTAKTARQDFSDTNRIELAGITGTMTDANKVITKLQAERGVFATQASVLDLAGQITVVATNGLAANLTQAQINTKAGTINSDEPVRVQMNDNRIDAKSLRVDQKKKTAQFRGDVVATLNPKQDDAPSRSAGDTAKPATALGQMMGEQNGPVTVTSETLDVDDAAGEAAFVGNVIARQGDAELSTAKLDIAYGDEGGADGGSASNFGGRTSGSQALGGPGIGGTGNVSTITAPGPVRVVRGAGQEVTAQRAVFQVKEQTALFSGNVQLSNGPGQTGSGDEVAFDARTNVAVLSGGVVLSGGPNQQARARRAEFNTANDQALLSGDVIVAQGQNVLTGGALFVDRAAGITRMTSPPGSSATPGRIAATLVPQGKPKSGSQSAKPKSEGAGGLATFRTDPNAPVSIEARQLDVNDTAKTAVFKGNVIAKQGGFTLKTAALKAVYTGSAALGDPGAPLGTLQPDKSGSTQKDAPTQVKTIRADGDVVVSSTGGQKATGDWATFDLEKNMVTVGGDVLLSQGKTVVRGTQLSIDMASGRSRITTQTSGAAGGWSTNKQSSEIVAAPDGGTVRSGFGMRGGRPSLTLYPQDLQSRRKKIEDTARDAAGGAWRARTQPE
ncbi:MAG: LPS export ABC transporter periplasmic protein LptC [Pseudomonadota bacterium]